MAGTLYWACTGAQGPSTTKPKSRAMPSLHYPVCTVCTTYCTDTHHNRGDATQVSCGSLSQLLCLEAPSALSSVGAQQDSDHGAPARPGQTAFHLPCKFHVMPPQLFSFLQLKPSLPSHPRALCSKSQNHQRCVSLACTLCALSAPQTQPHAGLLVCSRSQA